MKFRIKTVYDLNKIMDIYKLVMFLDNYIILLLMVLNNFFFLHCK